MLSHFPAEALHKLDGLSGQTLCGQSSVGSTSRDPSCCGTPGMKGVPASGWEGKEAGMSLHDKECKSRPHESLTIFTNGAAEVLSQPSGLNVDGPDLINFAALVSEEVSTALTSSQLAGKQTTKEAHTPNSTQSSFTQTTSHLVPTVISPPPKSAPTTRRLTPSSVPFVVHHHLPFQPLLGPHLCHLWLFLITSHWTLFHFGVQVNCYGLYLCVRGGACSSVVGVSKHWD